jgi:hypothetical protein
LLRYARNDEAALFAGAFSKAWMAGTSPAMTALKGSRQYKKGGAFGAALLSHFSSGARE